ncbi:20S-pre-rRNA D-site endonuclease nob1, partial [Coemansia sp. RSA 486]
MSTEAGNTVPASVQVATQAVPEEQKDQQLQDSQQVNVPATAENGEPAADASEKKKKKKKKSKGISIDQNDGKPVVTLVVDTNPFVKGLPLEHIATKFVTVPDVIGELKSRASKERYEMLNLKHGIDTMVPDAESMQIVCDFAKKTGDFASLSLADLRVVALAFMLEKQANGMRHLRKEPVGDQPNIADRKLLQTAQIVGSNAHTRQDGQENKPEGDAQTTANKASEAAEAAEVAEVEKRMENLSVKPSEQQEASVEAPVSAERSEEHADALSENNVLQSIGNDEFDVGSDEDVDEDGFDDDF